MSEKKEYCGLFGIYGSPQAVDLTYRGIYALQHRGQESAGICTVQGRRLVGHKGMGLVVDVFGREDLDRIKSHAAIGHVRYSTTGASTIVNAQPIWADYSEGMLAVAHNGNLVNSKELREEYESQGSIFQTTMDTEVILHILARPEIASRPDAMPFALSQLLGSYCFLFLTPTQLIAARDPNGFRPLCLGKLDGGWAFASETNAFDLTGVEYVRDVEPGEVVTIDKRGVRSEWIAPRGSVKPSYCVFEHVYFARPDSRIYGETVHLVREKLGEAMWREHPVEADIVVPIPDSGNSAAHGFARASKIALERGFIRNHYVGRTFIQPTQGQRVSGVEIKLNVVKEVVRGKRVVVVDDSIIRGNTSRMRVRQLRAAGASEVHMRVSCPPTRWPCYYGIDFPTRDELIAANKTVEEIRKFLELDSLGYLSEEGLLSAVTNPKDHYCTACFTGKYRAAVPGKGDKHVFERKHEEKPVEAKS